MKFLILFFMPLVFGCLYKGQSKGLVGINTSDPKATLDINGNAIIRTVNPLPDSEPLDRIVVLKSNNEISYTSLGKVFSNNCIVKGIGGSGFYISPQKFLEGWYKASFPAIEIDEGGDYKISSQEFVAPEIGIYSIYFSSEIPSFGSEFILGIGIFKIDEVSGSITMLSQETGNASILQSTKNTQALIKLNKGDKIVFGIKGSLVNISLWSNSNAHFGILRVK